MSSPQKPPEPHTSPAVAAASEVPARSRAYWRANSRWIAGLLTIWATVSIGCGIVFVEPLNQFQIGSLPLGFWFAQQGSIYVFVVLVFVYAVAMDRLDRTYRNAESKPNERGR